MATLQNIRSKGPLLVIVIGLALFAFIAGDAWKVLQPHQSQDVGEVNGESISAQDFQALVEEYTEVIKFSSGNSALSDEQTNQIKDEVWRTYVNNKLIEKEAKKLGLVVSKAEIQAIINAGVHPMLQQTPFRNPQTGAFDKDMLKKFLVDYSKMNTSDFDRNNILGNLKESLSSQINDFENSLKHMQNTMNPCTSSGLSSKSLLSRHVFRRSIKL